MSCKSVWCMLHTLFVWARLVFVRIVTSVVHF
nr:MAG TPA: hypothetical protein [Caudoviricetes sp.]